MSNLYLEEGNAIGKLVGSLFHVALLQRCTMAQMPSNTVDCPTPAAHAKVGHKSPPTTTIGR